MFVDAPSPGHLFYRIIKLLWPRVLRNHPKNTQGREHRPTDLNQKFKVPYFYNLYSAFPNPTTSSSSEGTVVQHIFTNIWLTFVILLSITSLSMEERIKIAHNAIASRVYDVLLESPSVPSKAKRQFVMDFVGYYHLLVDDRIGSRVGDRCWAYADTYLKVSIQLY
jgi:hypothetical protein